MNRIYIAGSSSDRHAISDYMAYLSEAGWVITHDWTQDPGWTDSTYPRIKSATSDLGGVATADVLWYVAPSDKSEGSHFELGYAAGMGGIEIITSGPVDILNRIFPEAVGSAHFSDHAVALAYLVARMNPRVPR